MEEAPKPFLEHLEELRFRLIKSLAAVAAGSLIGFYFMDPVIQFLSQSAGSFIFLHPAEAVFAKMKIALGIGVILSMPVLMFQIWKFIVSALSPDRKKALFWILPSSYFLFLTGFSFGFFVLVPTGVKFLLGCGSENLVPKLSIESYVNFVAVICIVLSLVFQMPLAAYFVSKLGFMDPSWLSAKRRYAILGIYILSALLTPGPDPITAIMLAVPTYLLFECSILFAKFASKK